MYGEFAYSYRFGMERRQTGSARRATKRPRSIVSSSRGPSEDKAMLTITASSYQHYAPIHQKVSAIVFTHAVGLMPLAEQLSVRETVRTLSALDEEGDSCDEHDFGEFEVGGEWYCWKIDLDDPTLERSSEDAPEPDD